MDVFHLGFQALHVFNTWLPHGKKHSCYVYGNHHLVESIVILCKKSYLCLLDNYYVGQERRDCALNLTNLLYYCSVESLGWLSSKAKEEWKILKSNHGWTVVDLTT